MDKIFNYDNKFFRILNKLVDMVILSVCWMVACIPVFTFGAASAALYDTARKAIHHDEGYVVDSGEHSGAISNRQQKRGLYSL